MKAPAAEAGPVVVRGIGAVSALGLGARTISPALERGEDGIRPIERFDMTPFLPVHLGGMVTHAPISAEAWATMAAREAWADARMPALAGAEAGGLDPARVAVVVGTTDGEKGDIARLGRTVADALGARGPVWTISTACSSSANALGLGRDLLLEGDADVVVAGGAEALSAEMIAGFASMGVLSEGKCAPFGSTTGTTLGEGAGFVVLERAGAGSGAGARAFFLGYGLSSDAWHETSPDPRGEGITRAMLGALGDAGVAPADVDYVNAHATGTAANDDSEWRGIERALGPRALEIPVNGSKGFFGHAQGAAGVLETLATLVSIEKGLVPPSVRIGTGRLRGPRDLVPHGSPRARTVDVAVSNSAAFGGANAVVVIGRSERAARAPGERRVRIEGLARIRTPAGTPRDEAALALAAGPVDLRSTDPSGRLMVGAAALALADAGLRLRGALRDRAGIFGAATRLSPVSGKELLDSIEKHGPERASAAAFARVVLHSPTGTASRLLGLRGPTTTLACEPTGLFALAYAGRWLARRTDADVLLVGGVDERGIREDDPTRDGEEGAACLVLSTLPSARAAAGGERGVELAGVASAGAGAEGARIAVDRARRAAGLEAREVLPRVELPEVDLQPSYHALAAVLDAVRAVREGERGAEIVGSGRAGSVAIVLRRVAE